MRRISALNTYESFASIYNAFNHQNNYEVWIGHVLLPALERRGLRSGGRALDVGCGTGRAFAPLLRRNWLVHGCDLSPSMLEQAHQESGGEVELDIADMRDLPVFGEFELVLSLNDTINYLLDNRGLRRALAGMRANLSADGLIVFDLNSKATYEGDGAWAGGSRSVEHEGRSWTWRARGEIEPSIYEVLVEGDAIETIVHHQRFRSQSEVREAMTASGLECRATFGMSDHDGEVVLAQPADESRHFKIVYLAARRRNQCGSRSPSHTS